MPATTQRGYVIPIGGAEKKGRDRLILERFVHLAGGADARLAVIPTASEVDSTGGRYARIFDALGAESIEVLPIVRREEAFRQDYLDVLDEATGIFLTGGNQLRLSTILGGTPVAHCIRCRNEAGVHVAGTSAGAAILSEHMIAGGESGSTPRADGVILAPGLGLTNRFIVDQHFRQRDRLGRLLTAISFNPASLGVGLDEDTALFLSPDGVFEVVGSGAVTVVDPSGLTYTSMDAVTPGAPVSLFDLRLHILSHGARFDTNTRQPERPERSAMLPGTVRTMGGVGRRTKAPR
ncbi:MAG TPA: cyanophycinase [Rubricoccaceae bacterium]|nr:cyanophycinase [Rubricoccaceae bacterium]